MTTMQITMKHYFMSKATI